MPVLFHTANEQKVNVPQWLFLRNCEKELMEVSLVTFPANELAHVSTVKSADLDLETPRDFECFLRESGFSRSRAKAITAKGFGGSRSSRDHVEDIAELVQAVKYRQILMKKGLGGVKKLTPVALAGGLLDVLWRINREEVNQISVMPGGSGRARIVPVSPGKVTFEVIPPANMRDAKFKCDIRYYKIKDNKSIEPAEITLTHNKLSEEVDRGILKAALPSVRLRDVEDYFSDLALNLTKGTTVATLDFHEYPEGHPHQRERTRGVFKVKAINHAVEQMKLERAIEQYRRRNPDQFDPS